MIYDPFQYVGPNKPSLYVGNSGLGSANATLFVFTPRFHPQHIRRSHLYEFTQNFKGHTGELLAEFANHPRTDDLIKGVSQDPDVYQAILPSAQVDVINTQALSEHWSFILIVDQPNSGIQNSSLPNRVVVSGYCDSEPVTMTGGGQMYINERARLASQNFVNVSKYTSYGIDRSKQCLHTIDSDDLVNGATLSMLHTDQSGVAVHEYSLDPSSVMNSVSIDRSYDYPRYDDVQFVEPTTSSSGFTIGALPLSSEEKSVFIPTALKHPRYHLQQILDGMGTAVSSDKYGYNETYGLKDFGTDYLANLASNSSSHMASRTPTAANIPNITQAFTMSELLKFYPNLHIEIMHQPFDPQYELDAQLTNISKKNISTALVSDAITAIMASFAIADVQFRYNSWTMPQYNDGRLQTERGVFQLFGISLLAQMSESYIDGVWYHFQNHLRNYLFPIIKQQNGEFDLTVHASLCGVTLVSLHYLDEVNTFTGLAETDNLLGGLNSPVVGTFDSLQNNATHLVDLLSDTGANAGVNGVEHSYLGY